jgi:mannose-1-phosphate guanylyltransferase
VIKGDVLIMDGKNNLIHSKNRLTAVVGVDNLVVINTKDATLIVSRDHVENVKDIVKKLQKADRSSVL